MISQRYHVYSLVAVFLALTVGVLLGISIGGGPSGNRDAITRQSQAIARLNQQFKDYSSRLNAKQEGLEHAVRHLREADSLIEAFVPGLISGKLAGRGAAIVQVGSDDETLGAVRRTLEAAGARVSSQTRMNTDFGFSEPQSMAKAAAAVPFDFQDPAKQAHDQLWGYLATVLAAGKQARPLQALGKLNLLRPSGDYSVSNRFLVVIVSPDLEASSYDLIVRPLLAKASAAGLQCCLAATLKPETRLEEHPLAQLDVPAVTHAGWAVGQLSLVNVLASGKGRYGFSPGDRLFPESLAVR